MNNKPKVTKTFAEEVMAMMVIDNTVEIYISSRNDLGMYITMRSIEPLCTIRREISKYKFINAKDYEYDKYLMTTLAEMYKELNERRTVIKKYLEEHKNGSESEGS